MKNILKKIFMFTSILGVVAIMTGCSSDNKRPHHNVKYVETHEDANVRTVSAKMYTHRTGGGETGMGHIKFHETESGLKMAVDLTDLRPGVEYKINVHKIKSNKKCEKMDLNLPTLKAGESRKLEQTYMILGLTAAELKNTKITLSREGSDKASWGKLESSWL